VEGRHRRVKKRVNWNKEVQEVAEIAYVAVRVWKKLDGTCVRQNLVGRTTKFRGNERC